MSNMLFCCSILFRLKLPLAVLFNKSDKLKQNKLKEWLTNYDVMLEDLKKEDNYLSCFSRSLCLSMDEFYKDLKYFYVSSFNG